jgi:hypothetical protein
VFGLPRISSSGGGLLLLAHSCGVGAWRDAELAAVLAANGVEFDEYDTDTFKTVDHVVTTAGMGRSAWFKDPDRNTIAVFEPE